MAGVLTKHGSGFDPQVEGRDIIHIYEIVL
jgi:hypothetical protein